MIDQRWIERIHEVAMAELDYERDEDAKVLELVNEAHQQTLEQRVESIRWCETHGRQADFCGPTAMEIAHGFPLAANCKIVSGMLTLPPLGAPETAP